MENEITTNEVALTPEQVAALAAANGAGEAAHPETETVHIAEDGTDAVTVH
jgi:hypothetical protein